MSWRAGGTIGAVLCVGGWILTDTASPAPGEIARAPAAAETAALIPPHSRVVDEAALLGRRRHPVAPPLGRRSPFEFGEQPTSSAKRPTGRVAAPEPPMVVPAPIAEPAFVLLGIATDHVGGRRVLTAIIGTAEELWLAQEGQRHVAEGQEYRINRIGEDWAEIGNPSTGRTERLQLR